MIKVKAMAYIYGTGLFLLGWFLQCIFILGPHLLMISVKIAI